MSHLIAILTVDDKFLSGFFADRSVNGIIELVAVYCLKLIAAIALLIVGFWLANKLSRAFNKMIFQRQVEVSVGSFLTSLINILLKILVIVIAVASLGVEMTSIAAILGAGSLAVGMALSGTLQNFAGGIVILFLKPFRVGDYIEAQNFAGTVSEIAIFTTLIKTIDNKSIFIPNGILANGSIINFNREGVRRIDLVYSIAYGDDVDLARATVQSILDADPRFHKTPEPIVVLSALASSSVNITVRVWVDASDYVLAQFELNEMVYKQFPQVGLRFPFPQLEVHTAQGATPMALKP